MGETWNNDVHQNGPYNTGKQEDKSYHSCTLHNLKL